MLEKLKTEVLEANRALVKYGLVTLTWGNVSGIDRTRKLIVIKPSGIDYAKLTVDDLVTVDMNGKVVAGKLRPSLDTVTHLALYRAFAGIGGIAHTHSEYATAFAQAHREIPCLGTTHADYFNGAVPVTRFLMEDEVKAEYELNTGRLIIERFHNLNAEEKPAVLVAGHAPFTWGRNPLEAVQVSLVLERIARMAMHTLTLDPDVRNLPEYLLHKHHARKHGPGAYYGQQEER